jgi:hypothetical protein
LTESFNNSGLQSAWPQRLQSRGQASELKVVPGGHWAEDLVPLYAPAHNLK